MELFTIPKLLSLAFLSIVVWYVLRNKKGKEMLPYIVAGLVLAFLLSGT
jgi:hypothetical protein